MGEPIVGGVTGLRPWEDKSSPFCFKRKAQRALLSLLEKLPAERALISYNSEGHIDVQELELELGKLGLVHVHELSDVARYAPNETARANGRSVTEYLIELVRPANAEQVAQITPRSFRRQLQLKL